jgi:hypothetical protein
MRTESVVQKVEARFRDPRFPCAPDARNARASLRCSASPAGARGPNTGAGECRRCGTIRPARSELKPHDSRLTFCGRARAASC